MTTLIDTTDAAAAFTNAAVALQVAATTANTSAPPWFTDMRRCWTPDTFVADYTKWGWGDLEAARAAAVEFRLPTA